MANERTGRLDLYGFSHEGTRGTAEASTDVWYPRLSGVIEDKVDKEILDQADGHIGRSKLQKTVKTHSEGSFEGPIETVNFGWLLGPLFGAHPAPTEVEEGTVADHIYPVQNDSTHNTLTIFKKEGAVGVRKFGYSMIETMTIEYVKDQVLRFTMDVKGKPGVDDTDTPAFSTDKVFSPANFEFKYATTGASVADTQTALTSASEVILESASLTFEKELIVRWNDGVPYFIGNGTMAISGDIQLLHTSDTYRDFVEGETNKAFRFDLVHGDTIGAASKPSLKFDLMEAAMIDYEKTEDLSDLSMQKISFEAILSKTAAGLAVATLRNTRTTQYA